MSEMMFDSGSVEERDIIPIPLGTPENIGVHDFYLTDVRVIDPTQNAGYSISFDFEYKGDKKSDNGVPYKGAKVSVREFDPTYNTEGRTDEQKKQSLDEVVQRITHILKRFLPEEVISKIKAPTWKDYISIIAKGLPSKANGVNCTMKLIYKKGSKYIGVPRYGAFLSTEFSPKEFKYDPQYDFLVPQGGNTQNNAISSDFSSDDTVSDDFGTAVTNESTSSVEDEDPFA